MYFFLPAAATCSLVVGSSHYVLWCLNQHCSELYAISKLKTILIAAFECLTEPVANFIVAPLFFSGKRIRVCIDPLQIGDRTTQGATEKKSGAIAKRGRNDPFSHIGVKTSASGTFIRHYELISLRRPITRMYLCPPFTPSFLTPTLIQPNRLWPGVPFAEILLLPSLYRFSLSPSFFLSISLYLSVYLCIALPQPRSNAPTSSFSLATPPSLLSCCLLPSAVSEFPRVRQRETITLRWICSPPISPCLCLPCSLCLSPLPFPLPFSSLSPNALHFSFFFVCFTQIPVSLHEPVHACTGHLDPFPSSCFILALFPPLLFLSSVSIIGTGGVLPAEYA